MERLQGPINPFFLGEYIEQCFFNSETLRLGEEEEEQEDHFSIPSLEDKMSFPEMLQSVESPQLLAFKEPNFQTFLRLQHLKKPWEELNMVTQIQALELESCVTHEIVLDIHSPVKSETQDLEKIPPLTPCFEQEGNLVSSSPNKIFTKSPTITSERRKRKRTKATKNKEEVESQRMTHVAVERNRRRQMNEYLNSLRSLMPPCYIQRGDQASILGGAIDFVKELEQLLQSLEAQKSMSKFEESSDNDNSVSKSGMETYQADEVKAKSKSGEAEIEVNVIHDHVNLKIHCSRKAGQLVQAIVTLESLRLTVLHLKITTSQASVLYSFSLKMEDDSELRSADEIEAAVHQIFN